SISVRPSRQPLGFTNFFAFAEPVVRRTPSIYWGCAEPSRGVFQNFSSTRPAAAIQATALHDISLDPHRQPLSGTSFGVASAGVP
ncbi:MAG TPA: hypothetical protein VF665_14660, partial [Longimicrobium sp.]|uniref:hypothetical protein n=1 Tax=Longimicrobium sp. TaxID=2029185 RepID=UPI002EDA5644